MFWSRGHKRTPSAAANADAEERTAVASAENENLSSLPMKERQDTAHDRALRDLGLTGDTEQYLAGSGDAKHISDRTASSAFSPQSEDVYDPATGAHAGVIRSTAAAATWDIGSPTSQRSLGVNGPQGPRSISGPAALGSPEASIAPEKTSSDEIWNHLSKIRVLQSDIAMMHLALDKTGIVEGVTKGWKGTAGTSSSMPLRSEDAGRNGRDRSGSIADLLPAVPEDEFARRKASIDNIISKVSLGRL